jgi:mono/diheme cytochrome c family protein
MGIDKVASIIMLVAGACALSQATAGDQPSQQGVNVATAEGATVTGWRTWRALACERCHGAQQEGLVGPSLVESLKRLSKDEFKRTVTEGRQEKGMPKFGGSPLMTENIDALYAYLKGRSDGTIAPGRPQP